MRKFFLGILLMWAGTASSETIAIVGDSITVGGASHSALAFDIDRMEAVFSGKQSLEVDAQTLAFLASEGIEAPLTRPERLNLSPREFTHPLVWMFNNFVTSMSSQYLDTEEFSWGYLMGRLRRSERIFIAGRDGEKSQHAVQQMDRILDGTGGVPVDHVFVFFTGNDICAPHPALISSSREYIGNISTAVRYLIRNLKRTEGITHIWLMDPLGVSQLATSPVIQEKKVLAFGAEHSCRALQSDQLPKNPVPQPATEGDPSQLGMRAILSQVFSGGTYGLCPSLFAYHASGSLEDLLPISNALESYRTGLAELAKNLNDASPFFRVRSLHAPASLMFEADEIGNDCFHLSVKGQLKIAKAIKAEIDTNFAR